MRVTKALGTRQLPGLSDFLTRSDTLAPLFPDYRISDFQSGRKFVISLHEQHDTRMKFRNRTRISLVELVLAERDSKNASVFFFRRSVAKMGACSQAFLTETVENEDKNREDFHCMQMNLVISMRY